MGLIPGCEGGEEIFLCSGANLHSVGDNESCLLLGHGCHLTSIFDIGIYRRPHAYLLPRNDDCSFPSEDVGIKTQVVGGDIHSTMHQNIFLESTGIITHQHLVGGNARKVFAKIITSLPVSWTQCI